MGVTGGMKDLISRLEGWHIVIILAVLGSAVTSVVAVAMAPHQYTACREMAHGNIQAYNECVRAEHGNR